MNIASKVRALATLMHEDHQLKVSKASAARCGEACAVLGLSPSEAEAMCFRLSLEHETLRPSFNAAYTKASKRV